jgi:hypothetical protein
LLSLLGTGSQRQGGQGDPDYEYSRELHVLPFFLS